ncbi:MAG: capsule biosynthesis protein CapA [Paracoccus sp. (in: a-proteobacteria)]|uniref:capsule biosynthesis protein n=1 Tax=Paracoccus sp. TaxID=267 RepID=UPI0026DFCFD7|nr:capsule biosynthesis protein CapA [Paracoccus sp. (in: a-proteobacteria)]MDO5630280.1 capsule biosynthesis protein CapA [Paracoccus sp. (in: a-proteobacteria)]
MLQGPHGPFFNRLGGLLRDAGATVWRVGFNAGDAFFWRDRAHFIPFTDPIAAWPARLAQIVRDKDITDIVLYGDVRPAHAAARELAARRGLRLHVFEEGYLRPFWISYERGGSNGHSALMNIPIPEMRATLADAGDEVPRPPAHWGDMREHKFYGALYHFMILVANRRFRQFRSHRAIPVFDEFRLHLRRLLLSPVNALLRMRAVRSINGGGWPFVLVLLQLEHDSNFQAHSPFKRQRDFTDLCLREFATHAPRHHRIVFKAHPLEDGRGRIIAAIREQAHLLGIEDRVHFVRGGKLASLLTQARAVLTVNSTAAQQALWRGLPVKALGRAVYDKPGLVSDQSLAEFIRNPARPDREAYRIYRSYLLQTSQVPGGFYAARSRSHTLRIISDLILMDDDPYETLANGRAALRQQIALRDA